MLLKSRRASVQKRPANGPDHVVQDICVHDTGHVYCLIFSIRNASPVTPVRCSKRLLRSGIDFA